MSRAAVAAAAKKMAKEEEEEEETDYENLLKCVKHHLKAGHDGVTALYLLIPERHAEWAMYHALGLLQNRTYATWMTAKCEKTGVAPAIAQQLRDLCVNIGTEYPSRQTVEAVVQNLMQWTAPQLSAVGY